MKKIKNINPFRYPGSKQKLLPDILPLVERGLSGGTFREAFVGGGAVCLAVAQMYPNIRLVVNDKDETVSAFWAVVSGNAADFHSLTVLVQQQPTIELFRALRATVPTTLPEKAYHAIFFNRTTFSGISTSGLIGGLQQRSRYTVDCRYNVDVLLQKLAAVRELLKGRCEVFCLDALRFLALNDSDFVYLDPPYYEKGSSLYPVAMSVDDHTALAECLRNKRGRWVLSYDSADVILDLYNSFELRSVAVKYCIPGRKREWSNKDEVIIMNF